MTEPWHHYYVIMTSYLVDNWFEFLNMFDEFIIVILKDFNFFQFISKLSVFSFYPFHISFTHAAYHGFLGTSRSQESIDPWLKKYETILSDSRSFSFSIPTDWTSWFFCWVKIDILTSSWGIVFTFYRSNKFRLANQKQNWSSD